MNAALTPTGLPDYRERTSDHSVSNHRRNDRGPPGCPAIGLSAYRPLYRLRHSLEGSPIHADRIEFTCLCVSRRCYGLVVLVPLLSTPCCHDAVTVRYPTTLRRRETDFHRSVFPPSQAHERDLQVNGTKLECNFRIGSYLRFTTPVRFLRILASVIAWSLLTVFIRR